RRKPLRDRRQRLAHLAGRQPDGIDLRRRLLGVRPRARGRWMSGAELDERAVPADALVERLDKAVAKLFGVSRGRAMEWIAEGRVRIDGRRAPKGAPVQPGARICVERPPPDQPAPEPLLPIRIVHADAHLIVADKPAGMPSHPLKPGERGARAAVTRFAPVERRGGFTLLEVEIPTGVMHQIRAHLAFIGHPLAGDALYGGPDLPGLSRHFLHASRLAFAHPDGSRVRY